VRRPFLTARWTDLVILNFEVPPAVVLPLVPRGTELDTWHGQALVSLVGFLFSDTRVRGLAIPWHRHFEEVNLRFYVHRQVASAPDRRAVVFVRELVPRFAIAAVARVLYNEPYSSIPMRHHGGLDPDRGGDIEYAWRYGTGNFSLSATVEGPAAALAGESEAEFITEHYWGYTRQRDGGTIEYEVEHPRWRVWTTPRATFRGPAALLYGPVFGEVLSGAPRSAFVAAGSEIAVHSGQRIT
jgi:uncharacterized protein YqjF (DUF2071 family)